MSRTNYLLIGFLFSGLSIAAPYSAGQPTEHETRRIADDVYMFRFRSHNSLFVVTGEGVIAFDPISTEAARIYREEIARVTPQPVRTIVYSHHHADHITGAAELSETAAIIAHAGCHERLAAAPNPEIRLPTQTFTDEMTLNRGNTTVRLVYLGRNHSDNSIVAVLPRQELIFAVDFVSRQRVGYRDLPDYYFPDLWESLERLQQIDYRTAVFGHGEPGTKADVYAQLGYWADLRRAVQSVLQAGLSEEEAVETISLPDYANWGGYADWFGMNVRALYRHYAGNR